MWPIGGGCNAHHFEPQRSDSDYRVRWRSGMYRIEYRTHYKCAHEGCSERTVRWDERAAVSPNKDEDGEWRDENAEAFFDALNTIRDIASERDGE